ncbi:type IV pilus assembly PilZ [Spirochaeta thermophila DSM 6578]|uniref:Type IV pilus assembly PilZ n=1 Tax=Winmispira thermophila (strain ATCC 700085 / DSM 6578 / Z-1203) TaxID=869211 RepID=G0GA47_WINT7|nr:PilZ domain-containing protein [Spirochaeta thermophila]AEJ61735.1 type IV pilus assembly PilZ [Spirochaeta thermophila DSM 6578]
MGTPLRRIEKEFILKSLEDEKIPVELLFQRRRYRAEIHKVDFKTSKMYLFVEGNPVLDIPVGDEVSAYFRIHGTLMTFDMVYLGREDDLVVTSIPEGVYRDLQREFERVRHPENVRLLFTVRGERYVLNFPSVKKGGAGTPPVVSPSFDAATISALLNDFRKKAAEFSTESKIVMFKERTPESEEERIITDTGKVLLYPQSYIYTSANIDRLYPQLNLLSIDAILLYFRDQGVSRSDAVRRIRELVARKREQKIGQELFAPILFYEYVIGYVYLVSTVEKRVRYDRRVLEYVHEFCASLAYSLKIHGYFKPRKAEITYDRAEIIDISLSGVLFTFPRQVEDDPFLLFSEIEVVLEVEGRKVPVKARVVRRFQDADKLYVALAFLDLKDDDRFFLARSLYGEDFSGEVKVISSEGSAEDSSS